MKKIIIATIVCIISMTAVAQKKQPLRSKQFSASVGYNKASKKDFSNYANGELNGMALQLNYEKYWNNIGLGIDLAGMYNEKPTYNDAGLYNHIFTKSATFILGTHYTTSTKATNLIRVFSGIGPNVKFNLSKNKKLQANIALRAGVTYTNGSSLEFGTMATPAFAWAGFLLNRNGSPSLAPGGSTIIQQYGTFYHEGYQNDLIGTGKAQLQLNYFIKPQLAIHLNGYYYGYMGSAARYNYIDWKLAETTSPIQNYWGNNSWGNTVGALNFGLSKLASYGASVGVTYQKGDANTSSKKTNNKMAVAVKDELTGLPLSNVAVSIVSADGKVYTATTNATGMANFEKIQDGMYKVSGILNDVITNEQTAAVGSNGRNTNVTLLHNDPRFTIQGKAINLSTTKPEGGVAVSLKNASKGSVKMGTSKEATGTFGFQIDANSDYELVGKKDSYISNIEKISTKGLNRSQTLYVELELGVEEAKAGKSIQLKNIYYDLDKSAIREDASSDLEKLIQFLQDNPSLNVEVDAHTDSRGSDEYNLKLSQDRAQAVVDYISKRGINKSRMTAKGYGETKLKNNCGNSVTCTEEQHQQNRRTEFIVTQ